MLTSLKGTYFSTKFGNKSMRKRRSESKLESKPSVIHVAQYVFQLKWYASLWGTLNALDIRECRQSFQLFENFFSGNFRPKSYGKIREVSAKNWMQHILQNPSHNHHWDGIHGILGRRSATSNTRPLKKHGFSNAFAKNSSAKIFALPNNSVPVNSGVANAAEQ